MDGARQELINLIDELISKCEAERHEARNELCLLCGKYKEAHHGACDSCKWRDK